MVFSNCSLFEKRIRCRMDTKLKPLENPFGDVYALWHDAENNVLEVQFSRGLCKYRIEGVPQHKIDALYKFGDRGTAYIQALVQDFPTRRI
jgi:hypothetical protein